MSGRGMYDFWNSASNILPAIGSIWGPIGAAVGGAAKGVIQSDKNNDIGAAAKGGISGLASNYAGKLFGGGSGSGASPSANYLDMAKGAGSSGNSGIGGMFQNFLGGLGNFFGGGNAYAAQPGITNSSPWQSSQPGQLSLSQLTSQNSPGGGPGRNPFSQQSSQSSLTNGGSLFDSVGGFLKKNPLLTGLGLMGASQLFGSSKVPELPQSIKDYQAQAGQGTALGNLASQKATDQLNMPFQQLSDQEISAAMRQLDQAQEEEMHQLTGTYKSLRPGTDITTDSSYAKDVANLNQRYAGLKADKTAQLSRQVSQDYNNQQAQAILQAKGIDVQRLQQLAASGQIDLDMALAQYGINDRDKQVIRNLLLQTGSNVAGNALDPNYSNQQMMNQMLMQQMMKQMQGA